MNETIFVQELRSSKSQRVQADERLALLFNLLLSEFHFFFFLLKLSAVCTFWIVLMC
jgi:hypothetical protein